VPRLSFAFALLLATVACNPKSLKPNFCKTVTDCKRGETCNPDTRMCEPMTTDGSVERAEAGVDAIDGRDASDVGEAPPATCRTKPMLCADGGYDGSPGVCEVEAGICVQCLTDGDCSQDSTKPICDTHLCRACKADSECTDPTICMTDGHCATTDEVIFVEFNSNGCPSANGSSTNPYCAPNDAVPHVGSGKNVIVIRGPVADRMTVNTAGFSPVIVGKKSASIPATAATAIQVLSDTVLVRDLTVTGGTAATSRGIIVSGATTGALPGADCGSRTRSWLARSPSRTSPSWATIRSAFRAPTVSTRRTSWSLEARATSRSALPATSYRVAPW
jgi:hypothetical protein